MADDNTEEWHDHALLLDQLGERLDRFHVLAASDDADADRLLNDLGGSGPVEHDMLTELSATTPLAHPERVAEAHAVAMRALEVLSRNGSRPPSQLDLGPLTGVGRYLVQQVIRYIVRDHQKRVADAMTDLYARRLGWTPFGDPSRALLLLRGRRDLERASTAYKKKANGIPTFLVGGAAISSLTQVGRAGASATGSRIGVIALGFATFLLLVAASWAILHGAAIARRRIQLTMDRPLAALWQTVGWCGNPPRDSARSFAVIAIALTVAGWVLIPLATVIVSLL